MNQKMSIVTAQIRAAKAMLRWSGEDLASIAGVSLSSVRRIEATDGVPESQNMRTILAIKSALEDAGIEFIGTPENKPGVQLTNKSIQVHKNKRVGHNDERKENHQ